MFETGADLVLVPPAGEDGLVESFVDEVAGLGSAESAQVVHECRELLAAHRKKQTEKIQFITGIERSRLQDANLSSY